MESGKNRKTIDNPPLKLLGTRQPVSKYLAGDWLNPSVYYHSTQANEHNQII